MISGTNETQLLVEFFTSEDPSLAIRQRANDLIASRKWCSAEVLFSDQPEHLDDTGTKWFSACFLLGLDHVGKADQAWMEDVNVLLAFSVPLADSRGPDSTVAVRFRSEVWREERIGTVDDMPSDEVVARMIHGLVTTHLSKPRRRWWQFWR